MIDAFAEGYERARLLAVRQEEAARREFIDDPLYLQRPRPLFDTLTAYFDSGCVSAEAA